MTPAQTRIHALWYEALGSDLGVRVRTVDPVQLRAMLLMSRRKLRDQGLSEDLEPLHVTYSPLDPHHEVWILHAPPGAAQAPPPA